MGWLFLLLLALLVLAALWRFAGFRGPMLQLAAAALIAGAAGYAWQGRPGQPGAPGRDRSADTREDTAFARLRPGLMGRFGPAQQWLDYSDALHRLGYDRLAVVAAQSGLKARPRDPDLWAGLANALIVYAEGVPTPAAQFALDRAEALRPGHRGAAFLRGQAAVQTGDLAAAERIWGRLLADAPADAPWREEVAMRLRLLAALRAAEGGR